MRELGLAAIYLAFFAILFSAVWNTRAVIRLLRPVAKPRGKASTPQSPDVHPSRIAMVFTAVCLATTAAALMHCFVTHRFDIEYVYASSDLKLAKAFLIASFWNGQEGTFLLWSLYLSLWGLLIVGPKNVWRALFNPGESNEARPRIGSLREPYVTCVHNWFLAAMMVLLIVRSPFHYIGPLQKWEAFLKVIEVGGSAHMKALPKDSKAFFKEHGLKVGTDERGGFKVEKIETKVNETTRLIGITGRPNHALVTPHDGRGLNELLQNPWMCIHPPIMFVGYSALALPFLFALGALIKRDYAGWIEEAFPFLIFPWAFLGTGLTLGGAWAYGVLGWHGYWAWDPVENASLFPWLTATGLIHGMVIQRKRGSFARANFSLAILAHLLVLYGTFLTRSGILGDASVHSFTSEGNELLWTLVFIGGLTIMASYGVVPLVPLLGVMFLLTKTGYESKAANHELPPGANPAELTTQAGMALLIGTLACVAIWYIGYRLINHKGPNRRMILFGLLGDRWRDIPSQTTYEDERSRDFFVFIGILALIASSAAVAIGTSSPILMTLLHWSSRSIKQAYEGTIQHNFYNWVHVPITIVLVLAMASWRYFPWKGGGGGGHLARNLPKHICAALLFTFALRFYISWSGARTGASTLVNNGQWLLIACASFAIMSNLSLALPLIRRATWKSGAFIAHASIGILLIGVIVSSSYEQTEQLSMRKGQEVQAFGGEYGFRLVSDDVNAMQGDSRPIWARDKLPIEYWANHGSPRKVWMAYPTFSLNKVGQYINVPYIAKRPMVDWYFAVNNPQDPSRSYVEAEHIKKDMDAAIESKDNRPVIRVEESEPATFKEILPGYTFTLRGYQIYKDQITEGEGPLGLLLDVSHDGKTEKMVAGLIFRGNLPLISLPVQIPGSNLYLLVSNRQDDGEKTIWQLRVTGGSKWLTKPDDINDETSKNTAEFPSLPGWKFRLKYPDMPAGMFEGKLDKNAAIKAVLEVSHGRQRFELRPGLTVPDREQIRASVPGTGYQIALESARPDTKQYLISLVEESWTPYWVVEVTHKPLINFVWIGVGLMVLGGLMSLGRRTRPGAEATALE